ncbi:MAG: PPC domain-containing protein [Candidatus Bathyarchaeota archaeon]|nr:PPC domain-containing protein [Candidatus Bathyarchaeota archaeon]
MEKQKSRRKWIISAAAIAIIVPVSLVTLSLNGFFSQSPTPETVTAETVTWEIERPFSTIPLKELVRNTYTANEETSVTLDLFVDHYLEDFNDYGGSDVINIIVNVSASVSKGFVKSVYMVFEENHTGSQVAWPELHALYDKDYIPFPQGLYIRHNLYPKDHLNMVSTSGVKAFLGLSGVNQPKTVLFWGPAHWVLRSSHNQTHTLDFRVELTYYNNTHHVKAVLPIEIVVWADAGNSFETARAIAVGDHRGFVDILDDPEDYYKIWVEDGQTIQVRVSSLLEPLDLDLYLYSPGLKLMANATEEEIELGTSEEISHIADDSGCWYIRVVNSYASYGWYQLSVKINGE